MSQQFEVSFPISLPEGFNQQDVKTFIAKLLQAGYNQAIYSVNNQTPPFNVPPAPEMVREIKIGEVEVRNPTSVGAHV